MTIAFGNTSIKIATNNIKAMIQIHLTSIIDPVLAVIDSEWASDLHIIIIIEPNID